MEASRGNVHRELPWRRPRRMEDSRLASLWKKLLRAFLTASNGLMEARPVTVQRLSGMTTIALNCSIQRGPYNRRFLKAVKRMSEFFEWSRISALTITTNDKTWNSLGSASRGQRSMLGNPLLVSKFIGMQLFPALGELAGMARETLSGLKR